MYSVIEKYSSEKMQSARRTTTNTILRGNLQLSVLLGMYGERRWAFAFLVRSDRE